MKVTKASVNKQLAELNKLFEGSRWSWRLADAYTKDNKPAKALVLRNYKVDYQSMGIWEVAADNSHLEAISTVIGSMITGIEWYKIK